MKIENKAPASNGPSQGGQKKVIVYSTPSCGFCVMAKEFFNAKKIDFTEKDVAFDIKAREDMISKSGQMGVPVIEIGEDIVIGFNQPVIRELLGIK